MSSRQALISLLDKQRNKCIKSLSFYRELERKTPVSEQWKFKKQTLFFSDLGGLIHRDSISPVMMLETIISTLGEYITAISKFNEGEWAAFLMGLGLNWLPIEYWGISQLKEYQGKIQKSSGFYAELGRQVPHDEQWKFEKGGVFDLPEVVPPDTLSPKEILKIAYELNESMLSALSNRKF